MKYNRPPLELEKAYEVKATAYKNSLNKDIEGKLNPGQMIELNKKMKPTKTEHIAAQIKLKGMLDLAPTDISQKFGCAWATANAALGLAHSL
jgi:hypothetical protein